MRPTEWSGGAIRHNILPPTLKTTTPSHCTVRVAAGSVLQKESICFGVMAPPYTAADLHAMVGHDRMEAGQAQQAPAQSSGAGATAGGDAAVVRGRRFRRGRDADPAGGARRRGASRGLRDGLGIARR